MEKIIFVTVIGEVLTEEAKKKLDSQDYVEYDDLTCDNGHQRSWYQNMDIPIPQELKDKEKLFNKNNEELADEDYEQVASIGFFKLSDFKLCVDNTSIGSTVFLRGGLTLTCEERSIEIYEIIEWEYRSNWTKIKSFWWDAWMNNYISRNRRKKKYAAAALISAKQTESTQQTN